MVLADNALNMKHALEMFANNKEDEEKESIENLKMDTLRKWTQV